MDKKETLGLITRYLLLIIVALGSLYLFYLVFTPLTIYPVFLFLKLKYHAVLLAGNIIFFKGYYAEIINACIGGAAYYLLTILNFTTPMKFAKRIKSLLFIFALFLVLNILRIIIFAMLLTSGYQYFDLTHQITWYFGSTILVVVVWFINIYLFKINSIPIYTDLMNIAREITKSKHKNQ